MKKEHLTVLCLEFPDAPKGRNGSTSFVHNNSIFVFAGRTPKKSIVSRRDYTNEVLQFHLREDGVSITSISVINPGETVTPRHCHGSCVHKEKFYSFGGSGYNGYIPMKEVIEFDPSSESFNVIEAKNPPETSRHGHACVHYNSKAWIFGGHFTQYQKGMRSTRTFFSDVIMFDFEDLSYHKVKVKGDRPFKRSWCSFGRIKDHMLIFGGFYMKGHEEVYFNDFFSFCFTTLTWTELKQTGDVPGVKNRSSFTKIGKNTFLLYCGNHLQGGDVWCEDIYAAKINIEKKKVKWKKLVLRIDKSARNNKYVISHNIAERIGTRIFIFGGEANNIRPNHVTVLELLQNKEKKEEEEEEEEEEGEKED